MKIAMISQVFPPVVSGASIVVRRISNAMVSKGHDVLVICSSDEGRPYRENIDGCAVLRMKSYSNPLRIDTRLTVHAAKSLTDGLRSFQPDVVHIHDPSGISLQAIQYAKRHDIPVVYSCHALPNFLTSYISRSSRVRKLLDSLFWRYGAWIVGQCDLIIAPTETIARLLGDRIGVTASVISYGVDRKVFAPGVPYAYEAMHLREKYGISGGRPVILHVGRLDVDKKTHLILEAFAIVLQQIDAQLVVVGDGMQRERLEKNAKALGVDSRTIFTGLVPQEGDLPGLYRLGDVFVSACEIETQGIVLIEAMSSGLPVVAVRASCIPEVVRDRVCGLLVEPGSPEAIAQGLLSMLREPGRAAVYGANGRDLTEVHSLETAFDQFEAAYRCVAGEKV